jgi:hypothetical protein
VNPSAGFALPRRRMHRFPEPRGNTMKLSAPTQPIFLISVVLFVLALLGHFAHIPTLSLYQFWFALAAYVVLAFGAMFKNM